MPKPIALATGQLNLSDRLEVQLHTPATEPAFVLIVWPTAASVAAADDDSFDRLVAATFKVMADARTALSQAR